MRKLIFTLTIIFFSLTAIVVLYADDDLIAYWSFDNETAEDFSGNAYHGQIMYYPKFITGVKGKAIWFQGRGYYSPTNNLEYERMGDHVLLPFIDFSKYPEFSITMWVKEEGMSSPGGEGYIWFGHVQQNWLGILNHVFYGQNERYIHSTVGSYDTDNCISIKSDLSFQNKWIFYAMVYKDNILKFFVNGKIRGKKVMNINYSSSFAALARHWWYYDGEERTSARFTGAMDEVKIYKRALTDEELSLDSLPCKTWFDYNNFQKSDGIKFAGNATKIDSAIRLTKNKVGDVGAIWYQSKLPLNNYFSTEFSFKFTEGSNFDSDDGSLPGADGIVFVIQNQGNYALGANGGNIGYSGINNAVAIEYDTYYNGPQQIENYFDPNGNHVALIKSENGIISSKHNLTNTLTLNDKIINLENNVIYHSKVEYIYSEKRLKVYLDKELPLYTVVLDYAPIDLSDLIQSNDNQGYLGFTSGTGSAFENHYILNWKYCSDAPTVTNVNENFQEINSDVLIYPNPSSDVLNISSITKSLANSKIQIFNFYGQDVTNICFTSSLNIQNLSVNISNLPSGIYLLRLVGDIKKNLSFIKN